MPKGKRAKTKPIDTLSVFAYNSILVTPTYLGRGGTHKVIPQWGGVFRGLSFGICHPFLDIVTLPHAQNLSCI